ncbi:MAG: tetratricopeptide repeat protein [Bacillota bacterium]
MKRPSIRMLTHVADRLRVSLEMLVPEVMENGIPVPEMIRLARSLCREDKFDLALDILQHANEKDEKDGGQYRVDRLEAEAYVQFLRSNLERALDLYSQVGKIRERGGNPLLIAEAYHAMGLVESKRKRPQHASHWFFIAWERLSPVHTRHREFALELLMKYGETLVKIGRYRTARSIYERSLSLMQSEDEHDDHVEVLRGIARCATETGDLKEAEQYLHTAVEKVERTDHRRRLAGLLKELGVVVRRQGRPDQALPHLNRALSLIEEIGGDPLNTINEIAECHLALTDDPPEVMEELNHRLTPDVLQRASSTDRMHHLFLQTETLRRKEMYSQALETAREAFNPGLPDSPGSLTLRILAVALDSARREGDSCGIEWVVDHLRSMAAIAT